MINKLDGKKITSILRRGMIIVAVISFRITASSFEVTLIIDFIDATKLLGCSTASFPGESDSPVTYGMKINFRIRERP